MSDQNQHPNNETPTSPSKQSEEHLSSKSLHNATSTSAAPASTLGTTQNPSPAKELDPKEIKRLESEIQNLIDNIEFTRLVSYADLTFLRRCWADFHLYITAPVLPETLPPQVIRPAKDPKNPNQPENVYHIYDSGNRFSTSVGEDYPKRDLCMAKLHNTVEKIFSIVRKRTASGGAQSETNPAEIRIAILGEETALRKAYKICLEIEENILISNYDPGEWAKHQLNTVERLVQHGYLPRTSKY